MGLSRGAGPRVHSRDGLGATLADMTVTVPEDAAREAGLHYAHDDRPGITRRRAGTGFSYRDRDGATIRDKATLARIRALAIPPAWTDVWICPDPDGHIQATGRDARGRKQHRYHARWRSRRDEIEVRPDGRPSRGAARDPRARAMPTSRGPASRARRSWPRSSACSS